MKKQLSFILAAALTATSFPAITASAENEKKDFVIFGDSIAVGETRKGNVKYNYGDILADYYGGTVSNFGVSGAKSDDLLNTVKSLSDEQKNAVKEAECVVISIGGNDIANYACEYMLNYLAKPNINNDNKNFLKDGYTADNLPDDPSVEELTNMIDADALVAFASDLGNALEVMVEIRSMASNLRNTNNGYIKTHIMPNISEITNEIKAINPDAQIIVQNVYQPLQVEPSYVKSTYNNSNYSTVINQLRDVFEGIMKTFNEQLDKTITDTGVKKADILDNFTSMEDGVTKSNDNPGHANYFIDIQTGSLSTGDIHPNQKGHLAIATKIIETLGETHNDGGLLSDIYENLDDKANYPSAALKTYEAAAGTYTMGDVNFDGMIDGRDATAVLTEYAKTSAGQPVSFRYRQNIVSEVTNDKVIDGRDATFILTYYAKSSAGSETATFDEYMKKNNK